MRTSTRLAWPTLNEPVVEPKSFIEPSVEKIEDTIQMNKTEKIESQEGYIWTIHVKPEHLWIGFLCLMIVFLFHSLSLTWTKIALLQDALSMK